MGLMVFLTLFFPYGCVSSYYWTFLPKWASTIGNANGYSQSNDYLFKEKFYEKRKKTINVLTNFFISHKSGVKFFFKIDY